MPRETPAQSDSESERVPSKKQKKEETPADDPMNEDGEDNEEAEENDGEGEEYEIEAILDSSNTIFEDVCPSSCLVLQGHNLNLLTGNGVLRQVERVC